MTIVRAPADVRQVVEAWVAAEPHCSTTLEIRIVSTDGGYYLLARDELGRMRDRIVPDAQSAGVLVASWIADDAPEPRSTWPAGGPAVDPSTTRPPVTAPAGQVDPWPSTGPGAASPPISEQPPGATPANEASPQRRLPRWLTAGGMLGLRAGGGEGVRAELDLATWRSWAFGVAASFSESHHPHQTDAYLKATDRKAMGYLVRNSQFGRWHVRSSVGAGVVATDVRAILWNQSGVNEHTAHGTTATAELGVSLGRELGDSWAIAGGPLLTAYGQTFTNGMRAPNEPWPMPAFIERQNLDLMLYIGLRHKL